jgi:hypothetical protein
MILIAKPPHLLVPAFANLKVFWICLDEVRFTIQANLDDNLSTDWIESFSWGSHFCTSSL